MKVFNWLNLICWLLAAGMEVSLGDWDAALVRFALAWISLINLRLDARGVGG